MTPSLPRTSRLGKVEETIELELIPLELRATIGLISALASLCIVSAGGVLWLAPGTTGYVGLAMVCGGSVLFTVLMWWLEPHKHVKHASHRLRHHARRLRGRAQSSSQPAMSDAEFEAIEDELDA
jgi:hypothetical protein